MLYKRIFWIIRCQCYHWSSMLFGSTGESPTPPILMKQPGRPNCGLNCSKRDLFLRESFLNCQSASGLQYKVRGYIPTHTHTHTYIYIHAHAHMICTHLTVVYCMWMFRRVQVVATWYSNLHKVFANFLEKLLRIVWTTWMLGKIWKNRNACIQLFLCVLIASNSSVLIPSSHHPNVQRIYIYIYVYVCNVCM